MLVKLFRRRFTSGAAYAITVQVHLPAREAPMKKTKRSATTHPRNPAQPVGPVPAYPDQEADELGWARDLDQREADKIRLLSSPLFREAATALDRIETKHDLSMESRIALRQALAQHARDYVASGGAPEPDLPEKAPELWSRREGRKENPVAFIRRVYAPWLDRGFTRAHLLALDRPLYSALAVWLHRHPETEFPEFITPTDEVYEILARRVRPESRSK